MKWFQHDTDMLRNRKIRKLIRTHGITGYGLWCALLEKLYAHEQGFTIEADDLWFEDLADDLKLSDYRTPIGVLDTLAELGLIDPQLWAGHVIKVPSIDGREEIFMATRAKAAERKRRQRARRHDGRPPAHKWQKVRDRIFERDGYTCQYCGAHGGELHCDHIIPVSRGGTNDDDNLATACAACNLSKSARTPEEWLGGGL